MIPSKSTGSEAGRPPSRGPRWQIGGFGRKVATLATGTALAQLTAVLVTPWLTRLYLPADFGAATAWFAIVSLAATLACGRYEAAVVLPSRDDDALNLLALSIAFAMAVTLASLVVVMVAGEFISGALAAEGISPWLWCVPPAVFVLGVHQALSYWSTRKQRFVAVAKSQLTSSVGTHASQLATGYFTGAGAGGLIGGRFLGSVVGALWLLRDFRATEGKGVMHRVSWRGMMAVGSAYSLFPRHLLWAHILNTLVIQLPVFFLTQSSIVLAGLFGLAMRLMGIPMTLLSASIGQVFYTDAARENHRNGTCLPLYRRTMRRLWTVSVLVFVPILLVGDRVYVSVLGAEWDGFSTVVRCLIPMYLVRFVTSPLAGVFLIAGKTREYFFYQLAAAVAGLVGLLAGRAFGGGASYLIGYSVGVSVVSLLMQPAGYKISSRGWSVDAPEFKDLPEPGR